MNKNNHSHFIWAEKYRPPNIKGMVLTDSTRKFFENMVASGVIPHMTLYSTSPGTGKSSLAQALCNDCGIKEYLYLNASKEGNIDVLRKEITQYVSVLSMVDSKKVVFLDEISHSSDKFQNALLTDIEKYSENCSFILTTNNINKIVKSLLSRCPVQDFNMTDKKTKEELLPLIIKRLCGILTREKINYDSSVVNQLAEKYYPDMRSMISKLQADTIKYGSITQNILLDSCDHTNLYDMILSKNIQSARKYLIESGVDYDEMYTNLFREFIPLIKETDKQNLLIVLLAKYSDMSSRAIDKEIIFTACMIELIKIIK